MKLYIFSFLFLMLFFACSKENSVPLKIDTTKPDTIKVYTAATIYNPIVGKWELGTFKILCPNSKDTTIYPNEKGDFVEFTKRDTAFYVFNSTNATGWSPYKVINDSTFILNGDTMHIISQKSIYLTTFCKALNGGSLQWMTYKKATN